MSIYSINSHPFLLLFLLLLPIVHSLAPTGAGEPVIVGGWRPIEKVSDPHIQELGKFAVAEYNKEKNVSLSFKRVVSGQAQVVAGVNYRLIVEAMEGEVMKSYEAEVWEKDWEGFKSLISFQVLIKG